MKYKYLLFDADNTLFDFDSSEFVALKNNFNKYSLPFSYEVASEYHIINKELWEDFEKGLISKHNLTLERFRRLLERNGYNGIDYDEFNQSYMYFLSETCILYPGAVDLLAGLYDKAAIYIITNGVEKTQMKRFNASPIKKFVRDIFVSERIGFNKPDKRYFDMVAEEIHGFSANKAIVIGDSLSSDMRGGYNSGIDTLWYNPENKKNTADFDIKYTAENYNDVYRILTAE